MFTCRLELDGTSHKLTLENTISILELGEILIKLAKCLNTKGGDFKLKTIEHNSYDPVLVTEDESNVDEFLNKVEEIKQTPFADLDSETKDFAIYLKKVLFERGIYIKATAENTDRKIELNQLIDSPAEYDYSLITSITAKIVSIVGKNEKTPYITIQDNRDVPLKVIVRSEQETSLSRHYKEQGIKFRIKIKKDSSGGVISATLIDFIVPRFKTLEESIEDAKKEYGDIFSNINDSAKLISDLRNTQ